MRCRLDAVVADAAGARGTSPARAVAPGRERDRRPAAHQPRPRAARRRRARGRGRRRGGRTRTSSTAWTPASAGRATSTPARCSPGRAAPKPGIVVNNNAAAVLLALGALARGREVIVSRGELVEIGGGFRVPGDHGRVAVPARRGRHHEPHPRRRLRARHRPTTPRCCSRSTRRTTGWSGSPRRRRSPSSRALGPPVMVDAGSGLLDETTPWLDAPARRGCATSRASARRSTAGAALVTFSGDKLLGGPQAGIIVGRADPVATIARHPLARAMRADKITLALLQSVALAYLSGDATAIPLWRMATTPVDDLRARAERHRASRARARRSSTPKRSPAAVRCPGSTIPSVGVARRPPPIPTRSRARLREHDVVARVDDGRGRVRPAHRRPRRRRRWPRCEALARRVDAGTSRPRATSTTASRRSSSPSPAPIPTASPKRRRAASRSTSASRSRTLPSGTEVGFVDVPGHVRFLKNMLAGVGAVDVALLVVVRAAKAGCPRARSTCASSSCSACDTAWSCSPTPTRSTPTRSSSRSSMSASALHGRRSRDAAIVVCDSVSGRGLDDVRAALDAVLRSAPPAARRRPAPALDRPRVRGQGRGHRRHRHARRRCRRRRRRARGRRAPAPPVRVRGIETAHRHVDRAAPGTRVALNLAGVEHSALARGDALVRPGQWTRDVGRRRGRHRRARGAARAAGRGCRPTSGPASTRCGARSSTTTARFARLRFAHADPARARRSRRAPRRRPRVHGRRRRGARRRADAARRATRAARLASAARGAAARRARGGCSSPTSRASPACPTPDADALAASMVASGSRCASAGHSSTGRGCSTAANGLARPCAATSGVDLATLASTLGMDAGDAPSDGGRTTSSSSSSAGSSRAVTQSPIDASPEAVALARRPRRVAVLATRPVDGRSRPRARRCARPPRRARRHRRRRLHRSRPSTARASWCASTWRRTAR